LLNGRRKEYNQMRISGKASVNAPCEAIWELIFDPSALLKLVPGCDQVEQVAPDQYQAIRVPALAGSYAILIRIMESEAPRFCRLAGNARGPSGVVQGTGTLTMLPQGKKTRINYESEIQISGPLAGMHPRFIEGVAQTLIRQGLGKLAELARATDGPKL
jgi:carbon monoxide dehydrogenase subunit G